MAPPAKSGKSRIKTMNEEIILEAALEMFSRFGFRGTTVEEIARQAGMSKPNLLYYFKSKDDIYVAVLERTLSQWLRPLTEIDPAGDPIEELRRYITAKIEMSRSNPLASRLFANEILQGAPKIAGVLTGPLKDLVDRKAETIRGWIAAGKIAAVDPYHLIFMIWATTQHYADFAIQIRAILGAAAEDGEHFKTAQATLSTIILGGLAPAAAARPSRRR